MMMLDDRRNGGPGGWWGVVRGVPVFVSGNVDCFELELPSVSVKSLEFPKLESIASHSLTAVVLKNEELFW